VRNWEQYVRTHLSLPDLARERESRILRELSSQLEDFYREAVARGMTESDADAHARAQITDWAHFAATLKEVDRPHVRSNIDRWSERLEDHAREQRGRWLVIANLWQDVRYASRRLVEQPGFTMVVVLTLALGIGANTAIFSIIDRLLLESLPVDHPRELVLLNPAGLRNGWTTGDLSWSYQAYRGLRDGQRVFSGLIAERTDAVNLTIDGATQRATASIVSGNYFDVLGIRPLMGRLLSDADDRVRNGHPVVVLSYGFWVERFGMRPDIVGRDVRVGGHPFTVIGIAEKRFNGLEVGGAVDLFVPAMMLPRVVTYAGALDARTAYIFNVYGRLKPGVSREQAEGQLQPLYVAELEQDVAAMGAERPSGDRWRQDRVLVEDGHRGTSALRGNLETPLTAVMAMTILLLVITCANLASLQIARASARMKEISIRLAIGASRSRVVLQLLTESALIVVVGALAALLVAGITVRGLVGEMGEVANRLQLVMTFLDTRILAFTLALGGATTILVGLVPALLATRPAVWPALRAGLAADIGGQLRLRRVLVTAQLALSLVLVTGSGLFVRTVYNLRHTDTGFRTDRLVQFRLNPGAAGYDRVRCEAAFRDVLEGIRALPGVEAASLAVAPMLDNGLFGFALDVEGYSSRDGRRARAGANIVAPGYFRMMSTPLVRGRDFSETDTALSRRVAIVSESFVKRYLPDLDPIGRTIGLGYGGPARFQHEIVGVSKDARLNNLRDEPVPTFYLPYSQFDVLNTSFFLVRASADPSLLRRSIEEVVRRLEPDLPVIGYVTIDEQIDRLLRPERLVASLSLSFGVLATVLGAIGLYGVMAFSVARRTREIGLRMALGADRGAVLRMILRGAVGMAAIGICLGVVIALALGRYVESQLYGIRGSDLLTLGGAAGVLVAVVLASGWLPARRASRVDPMLALRCE
jgi:putative ABC transport system permease protein